MSLNSNIIVVGSMLEEVGNTFVYQNPIAPGSQHTGEFTGADLTRFGNGKYDTPHVIEMVVSDTNDVYVQTDIITDSMPNVFTITWFNPDGSVAYSGDLTLDTGSNKYQGNIVGLYSFYIANDGNLIKMHIDYSA